VFLTRRTLGVDVGPARARAAQVAFARGKARLEGFAQCEPPAGEAPRAAALAEMLKTGGFRAGLPAQFAAPGESVFFHGIDTDLRRLDDVRRVLPFETEGEFPYPPEELVMDICSARASEGEQQHVLISAVRREALVDFLRAPAAAGLEVGSVDAAACALSVLAARAEPQLAARPHLIVYLSESQSLIAVAEAGRLLNARNLPHAGSDPLTPRAIERESDLCWRGVFKTAIPAGALGLVGGEPGRTAGLAEALKADAGLDVRPLDPAPGLECDGERPGPEYALAVALALGDADEEAGPNFLLADGAAARAERSRNRAVAVAGVLVAAIAAVWIAGLVLKLTALKARDRAVRAETDRLLKEVFPGASGGDLPQDALDRVESRLAEERREHAAFAFLSKDTGPVRTLQLVSVKQPPTLRMKVTALEITERSVRLAGAVDSYKAIDELRAHLQSVPEFSDVAVREEAAERGSQMVRFSATFNVRGR
jgi:hypothetical protein